MSWALNNGATNAPSLEVTRDFQSMLKQPRKNLLLLNFYLSNRGLLLTPQSVVVYRNFKVILITKIQVSESTDNGLSVHVQAASE